MRSDCWRWFAAFVLASGVHLAHAQGRGTANGDAGTQLTAQDAMRVLSEANDLLRDGRVGASARKFEQAIAMGEGTPLAAYAQLGLAWTEVARGDLVAAEVLLEDAVPVAGDASPGATILLGLLHGSGLRAAEAVRLLDGVIDRTRRNDLRVSARLARGYVYYWAGDFTRAAADFDAVASGGVRELVDDGSYGAAWARWRAGDRAGAEGALRVLAENGVDSPSTPRISWPLVDLRPKVVLSDAVARYRRAGLERPGRAIVVLLDADGAARARRALRGLAAPALPSIFLAPIDAAEHASKGAEPVAPLGGRAAPHATAAPEAPAGPRALPMRGGSWWGPGAIALVLVLVLIGVARRRRR